MYMNRLITLLVLSALAAVAALVVREASATTNLVTELDSATLSYASWAESVEAGDNPIDSASRSYIAQAKAAFGNADLSNGQEHDSATRSYIAWARAVSAGESC